MKTGLMNLNSYAAPPSANIFQSSGQNALAQNQGSQNQGNQSFNPKNNQNRGRRGWNNASSNRSTCQTCGKLGHTADIYFFHYNKEFNNLKHLKQTHLKPQSSFNMLSKGSSSNPSVLMANIAFVNSKTVVNPNWYADSGATNHVTANPNFLNSSVNYSSMKKVVVGDDNQLASSKLGIVVLNSGKGYLKLSNVLCVSNIVKNLVSVSKFASDNHVFIEFHFDFCVVKDKMSMEELLKGILKVGLYRLKLPN